MPETKNAHFNFTAALATLNPHQLQAVQTLEGPVMVIAGPGTGKTQVLTTRIANLIYTHTATPQNILALTFTNAAAANMQKRLIEMIGPTGYQVKICTFHSFCSEVINDNPIELDLPLTSEPLGDLAKYEIFEQILTKLDLQKLKSASNKYFFLTAIIGAIEILKREGITPTKFAQIIEEEKIATKEILATTKNKKIRDSAIKNLEKHVELLLIYHEYQNALTARGFFDYNDMINLTISVFKNQPNLLASYQEQFQYLLVDEYQDTNSAQDEILNLLTSYWGDSANIFVVGDPNQSIYRFQGASLENFLGFVDRYPSAQVINLDIGYRCSQIIYDSASKIVDRHQFTAQNGRVFDLPPLQNIQKRLGTSITVKKFPDHEQELYELAQNIKDLHKKNGVPYEKIAWLYKKNAEGLEIKTVLTTMNIPFATAGDLNLFEQPLWQQFFNLLKIITNLEKPNTVDALFYQLFNYEWFGFSPLITLKLARLAHQQRLKISELLLLEKADRELFSTNNLSDKEWKIIDQKWQQILQWHHTSYQEKILPLLQKIYQESGLADYINQQPTRLFLLNCFVTFCRHATAMEKSRADNTNIFSLTDLCQNLDLMKRHQLPISVKDLHAGDHAVALSTVHHAKGLEWEHVFLSGVADTKWGNERKKIELIALPKNILRFDTPAERDEETARLFYVALTRAKKNVILSTPTKFNLDDTKEFQPSQFIAKLHDHSTALINTIDVEMNLTGLEKIMQINLTPPIIDPTKIATAEKNLLQELLADFILSPTSLNDYLKNTDDFITKNLLHAPTGDDEHGNMAFGTAMHSALELMWQSRLTNTPLPTLETLQNIFNKKLGSARLTPDVEKMRRQQGKIALDEYYQKHQSDQPQIFALEKNFGTKTPILLGDVPIKGKIDRLDLLDDDTLVVTDYKTGTPKTDKQLAAAGSGASEREKSLPPALQSDVKRQLLFYKILVENEPNQHRQVSAGQIAYVVSKPDKPAITRTFAFTDEEVEAMKNLIIQVDHEIRNLDFLQTANERKV